ncbi:hypothetical protein [Thalassospira australica]
MLKLLTRTKKFAALPAVFFAASLGLAACDAPEDGEQQMPQPQEQPPAGQ